MEVKDEAAGGTRCRCCYAAAGGKLLQYGAALYSQMMRDTFSIALSSDVTRAHGVHMCEPCLQRLRDASGFRRLVLTTEQRFQKLLEDSGNDVAGVKLEPREAGDSDVGDVDYLHIDYADDENEEPIKAEITIEPLEVVRKSKIIDNVKKAMSIAERMSEIYRQTRPQLNMDKLKQVNNYVRNSMDRKGTDFKIKGVVLKGSVEVKKRAAVVTRTIRVPRFKQNQGRPLMIKRTAFNTNATNTVGAGLLSAEKRAVRRIIKQNALAILKNTTACPFIYFHSNFRCFYCREAFYDFAMLRNHTVYKHNDVKQEARKINAFRDLMMVDITFLKCRRCDQDYGDIETIKEHLITAHNVAIDRKHKDDIAAFKLNAENFKCHLCNEEFHVFRNLSLHLNKHYSNYMCDVCGKPFISWERYKNHENTHVLGHFPCTKCDDVFNTLKERAAHSMAKHRITRYGCPLCTERFDKYLERTVHMSSAHNITHKFKCSQCPKEYFHKPHLRAHVSNTHRPREKKVECGECGMRFTDKNAMNRHMVSHTGEKSFVCKVCGKKYGRKYSLTEHMRSHNKPSARGRPVNLMSF